jgi:hypothetical protein
MPSAVPFQQGLIGQYNNASSPGVYVAWDANTSFNSVYSLIFKGNQNTNYRFPLITNTYNSNSLGIPKSLAKGSSYIYALNSTTLIVYQIIADTFSYIGSAALVADKIAVVTVANVDYIFAPVTNTKTITVYTFSNSTLNTVGTVTNFNSYSWNPYDFVVSSDYMYFATGNTIYQLPYTITTGSITPGAINTIAPQYPNNAAGTKNLAVYGLNKIATIDINNVVYEFINNGPLGVGNTSGYQWDLNFALYPTSENYQYLIYNHSGLLIACDGAGDQIVLIAGQNVTTQTKNYGSFDGFTYQVVSTTNTSTFQGNILNTLGSEGTGYQQFNNPISIVEDQNFNLIVGDNNQRLTYIPVQLDFIALVEAPLTEYVDSQGGPETVYYIKQSTQNFTSVFSIAPITGDELLIKSSVLYELNALLRVPVYDEEPIYGYLRQTATLAYGDIVTDPAPQVRITCATNNGQTSSMFVLSPYVGFNNSLDQAESDPFSAPTYNPNYPNGLYYRFTNEGKLYFFNNYGNPVSIQEYDTILVTYYVKLFTNAQINNALYLALQAINAQPGLNKISSVVSVPFYYDQTLVAGATYYLLRQLAVGLNSRERRLLVQDPDQGSFDAVANIKDTAKMYQEEFGELLKKLPLAVRPIMGTISVPEYALPGGRSRLFRSLWKGGAS